ncbi:uncharacterized protein LOC141907019 [Tubulanus polymorphus]|uniref:uncharacterized protein LOC141907019 n=1 Tax=Tubulanus polymorphus TaxID=672921 RepID=UPI003DA3D4EC
MEFKTSCTVLWIVAYTVVAHRASAACPPECVCPTDNTIDCSSRRLTSVPAGIGGHVVALNLSNNSIPSLDFVGKLRYLVTLDVSFNALTTLPDDLCTSSTPRLQELVISHNAIKILLGGIFSFCSHLSVLDLSDNKIDPKSLIRSVQGSSALRSLDISGNRIVKLLPSDFTTLTGLVTFSLSRMGTKTIDIRAFDGLTALQRIDLSNNELSTINPGVVRPLSSLWQINLEGNKFLCDCTLNDLKDTFASRSIIFAAAAACYVPKNERPFDVQSTDLSQFCPSLATTTGPISSPSAEPEPRMTTLPTLSPADCKRLRPYELSTSNITNVSTVLKWRSDCTIGGADVDINLRNIDAGKSTVETVARGVDVARRTFPLFELAPNTYYAICIKLPVCNYESCSVFRTIGDDYQTTMFVMTSRPSGQSSPDDSSRNLTIGIVVTVFLVALFLGGFIALTRTSDKFYYTVFRRVPRDMKMAPDLGTSQSSLVVIANGRVNGAYAKHDDSMRSTDVNSNSTSPRSSIHNQPYLQVIEGASVSPDIHTARVGDGISQQTDYTSLSSLEEAAAKERKYEKLKPVPGQVLPGRSPLVSPQGKQPSYLKRQAYDPDYLEPRDVSSDSSSGCDSPDVNDPLYVDYDQSPRPPRYSQIHNLHGQQAATGGESASSDYLKPDEINGKSDSPGRKRRPKMGVSGTDRRTSALPPVPSEDASELPTHPVQRGDSTRSGPYEELNNLTLNENDSGRQRNVIDSKIDEGIEPDVNVVMLI